MTRIMLDVTHANFAAALPRIRELPAGSIVALYDTGSPDIAATPEDIAQVPVDLHVVFVDQGFTGSPNHKANVRDCENGAWTLSNAVETIGWTANRPMLYLGFPNTLIEAWNAGWDEDVWVVAPSTYAPVKPPPAPGLMNVVAVQWKFAGPWDESVVFDNFWPNSAPPQSGMQDQWRWCHKCQSMFFGPNEPTSVCPAGGKHDGSQSFNYSVSWTRT